MTWPVLIRTSVLICFPLSILAACTAGQEPEEPEPMGEEVESAEGFESHPQSHLVPHDDVIAEQLDAHSLSDIEAELPGTILLAAGLMDGESPREGAELDLLYRNFRNLNAASLSPERLLFMENNVNRFVLYDVESGEMTELASETGAVWFPV